MGKIKEVETHELTEAEVYEIHKHGSPHQQLDPTPHPEPDYSAVQMKQALDSAHETRDSLKSQVAETLKKALPKKIIPRYLRRAVWSKDPMKIYKAVAKAKSEGWTNEEMLRQVKEINEHNQQTKKYEVQE